MPVPHLPPELDSAGVSGQESRKRRHSALTALADRQDGVVSLDQLRHLGFSEHEIRARIRRGDLIALHRGVFIFNRRSVSARAHLRAALLAFGGPDAFLSHRTAAAVYGLRAINRFEIHVTTPGRPRGRTRPITVHRTSTRHRDDVRTFAGLRVSSVPRMLIELAPHEPASELDRLITEAARRDLLHVDRLQRALTRNARRPGVAMLTRTLGDYIWTPRDASTLERDFAAFIASDPAIPTPQRNVILGRTYEIDFLWPSHRLAVELDGRPYHQAVRDRERDNAKDIWLQKRGIRSMRIRDFRFEHDKTGIRFDLLELFQGPRPERAASPRAA